MSYAPLGDGRPSPHVENIELTTKNGVLRHLTAMHRLRDRRTTETIMVARLDGKVPVTGSDKLEEMLLHTPTVFPLLFAALMGRFFRHLGIWLAERGTTLGRLEQLVGCQSVFLAIERQICLRNFSIVGVCLILIWLLSPFGGQSALRVLRQEVRYVNTTQTLHYLSPLNTANTSMSGASNVNSGRSTFTPLFLAALLSSGDFQTSSADLWGNVKLPSYRSIENSSPDDWKPVPDYNHTNLRWSSLIGIPVSAFNGEEYTTASMSHFMVRARHFDIKCTNNSKQPTCHPYPCPFVSMSSAIPVNNDDFSSVAICEYYYDYVESSVQCIASTCRVTAMRKLDMFTDGYTQDSDIYEHAVILKNLMNTMTSVDTRRKWMFDPSDFMGMYSNVNLYAIPSDVFAERLTILWNSFFQATYAARAVAGNLGKATSTNITGNPTEPAISFNTTESLVSQRVDVYQVKWKWFGVLLSCSLVLLCAAYAGLVLKYLSIAPDIIGYASSLTMLNPYVPTPTGGTTLHGLERTALLHDMPVRIGDVCPDEPVGAIALAANDGRVAGLDRRRWYI
ncbi:hypothetical protein EJ07DRAFT_163253 [Lizonia empirigonia]|nr:hypothetical protein EJ07DRAFT_163253 [Lizonia empirigonia]